MIASGPETAVGLQLTQNKVTQKNGRVFLLKPPFSLSSDQQAHALRFVPVGTGDGTLAVVKGKEAEFRRTKYVFAF